MHVLIHCAIECELIFSVWVAAADHHFTAAGHRVQRKELVEVQQPGCTHQQSRK